MRKTILSVAALTIAATLVGCESQNRSALYSNLTPELQGLHERPVDVERNVAYTNNFNMRMISDDLGRVFYTNSPSRLSGFPPMSLTGNPY